MLGILEINPDFLEAINYFLQKGTVLKLVSYSPLERITLWADSNFLLIQRTLIFL